MTTRQGRRRAHVEGPSLARDGGRTIVGAIVSNACNFAVLLLLARALGSEAVGLYSIVFAIRAILVLICALGMRVALTHFMARGIASNDPALARGSALIGTSLPVLTAIVVACVSYAAADTLAHDAFGKPELENLLKLVSLSLPFSVAMDVALSGTQGFLTMRPHARIALVFEPSTRLVLTLASILLGFGLTGAVGAILVASVLAGVAALAALVRMTRGLPGSGVTLPWRDIWGFAMVSWVASIATQGLLWADVVILGTMVDSNEVGVYQVATRVVLTAMIVIIPLTASMAPRIAHAWTRGDLGMLERSYQGIVLWSWRLTLPILTGVVLVPTALLRAFGNDFGEGLDVVYVLVAGAMVEAIAAPSAVLLNQIGRNRLNMAINLTAVVANVTLNIALIPVLGILGSAIAWALTLVIPGLVRIVVVRRVLDSEWPFTAQHVGALGAAALAGLTAAGMVYVFPTPGHWAAQLVVAATSIVLVYPIAVLLLGLRQTEKERVRATGSFQLRATSTRFPALRRIASRWRLRGLERRTKSLEIRRLVSPYRYDVLARVEFFRLARANRDLLLSRPEAFMDLAKKSAYRRWFDNIVLPGLNLDSAPAWQQDLAFSHNVQRSLHLLRSFERRGFDARHPISVVRIPAGLEIEGRALGEDGWAPYDGCHRLALLLLSGQTHLTPDQYVVHPDGTPRFNTLVVARAERVDRPSLVRFFAWGLIDGPDDHQDLDTWEALVARAGDAPRSAFLARWPEASYLSESAPAVWYDIQEPVQTRDAVR